MSSESPARFIFIPQCSGPLPKDITTMKAVPVDDLRQMLRNLTSPIGAEKFRAEIMAVLGHPADPIKAWNDVVSILPPTPLLTALSEELSLPQTIGSI